jgi:hypothetical protein
VDPLQVIMKSGEPNDRITFLTKNRVAVKIVAQPGDNAIGCGSHDGFAGGWKEVRKVGWVVVKYGHGRTRYSNGKTRQDASCRVLP